MNKCLDINGFINRLSFSYSWVLVSRLIRFATVGLSGIFVDMGGFYILHNFMGWMLTPSTVLSTELAIINNFFWNDVWTFSDVSLQQPLIIQRLQRFWKFNLICLLGLVCNILIVDVLFYKFGVNEYVAKVVAIILVTFWNFGVNFQVNWQLKKQQILVIVPQKIAKKIIL